MTLHNKLLTHIFAVCQEPQWHPVYNAIGKPLQMWCFEPSSVDTIIPIEDIASVGISCYDKIKLLLLLLLLSVSFEQLCLRKYELAYCMCQSIIQE